MKKHWNNVYTSLQCKRILGGPKFFNRIATMKQPSWILWQRKIGESRNSFPFPSVFWNWSGWECRVYYAMRKSKRLHWSSGQDLLAVIKPTPLLPHAKMLLVPIRFFFWRVDYALEGSMFWLSKCDFSRLFHTERSWHAYWFSLVFEFLVFTICPLMQERFLWPLLKRKALFVAK